MLYGVSQTDLCGKHDQFTDVTLLITEIHWLVIAMLLSAPLGYVSSYIFYDNR